MDGQAGRQLADTVLVMSGVAHISDRSVAAFSPTAPAGTMSGSHACCSLGSSVRPEAGYSLCRWRMVPPLSNLGRGEGGKGEYV